jgi:hypothetical protein
VQGGFPQQGSLPAGYPYPPYMMPGYPPLPVPGEESGKAAAEPATKGRKRRKKIPQGGPKKPATSFVLFSNTVREQVKEENPGLSFLDLGKKLGEMWREMEPNVRSHILYARSQNLLTPAYSALCCRFLRNERQIPHSFELTVCAHPIHCSSLVVYHISACMLILPAYKKPSMLRLT